MSRSAISAARRLACAIYKLNMSFEHTPAEEGADFAPSYLDRITRTQGIAAKAIQFFHEQIQEVWFHPEAQLSAAQAKYTSDQGTYLHLAAAAETPGVVAGNDLQVANQTAVADKAEVEASTKNGQASQNALRGVAQLESYLEIRAPFDGVVTQRNLHPGALVGPASGQSGAQPIVQVENLARLQSKHRDDAGRAGFS